MRFYILAIAIFLWFSSSPISAHFFPNISSIPPWLLLPNASATAWDKFQKFNGCHSGEKVDGLAKLKQYFQHFGYIPNSNFTDDFDGDFESALKTYQKNFNLNETGELDEQTLKQIVRPRCGIADIINGTTTMNSRKYSADGSHRDGHFHTTAHYSFFPNKPLWPENRRDLTYSFLPDNQLSDPVRSLFRRAFQRWSEVIPMTFTETSSFYTADIKIGFFSGDHGDGEPFDGVLGTLAHAFSPPSGRFHLDGDENWVINGDVVASAVTSAVDLESVAVHEIGHLLGLGHSSVEDSIMFPTISAGTRKVELHSDDIEGVQVLYGPNPNYNGTSSTTTTTTPPAEERDTGNNSGSCRLNSMAPATVLLSVGVLVLVLIL